eukprot:COSAG02_NODE_8378_length_2592_cov_2.590854_2_plen_61_part_01
MRCVVPVRGEISVNRVHAVRCGPEVGPDLLRASDGSPASGHDEQRAAPGRHRDILVSRQAL